ncbi:hypothetical protein SAMN05216228_104242 [Rhizobium tibeticum]|uniref:Uncharacterized protein n=1 Tax=Rhizobium tibeticum TaxID=501024 RepID=A0A1H8VH43_9HYPH|nr:hypothetical protein RTCCBAU85039_6011 [Rhizobium tibeticum]SEP14709.1 hypothetical protein SAMN05216228_104242 [Rhizobium tibeticum]
MKQRVVGDALPYGIRFPIRMTLVFNPLSGLGVTSPPIGVLRALVAFRTKRPSAQ